MDRNGKPPVVLAAYDGGFDDGDQDITLDTAAVPSLGGRKTIEKCAKKLGDMLSKRQIEIPKLNGRQANQALTFGHGRRVEGIYRLDLPMLNPTRALIALKTAVEEGASPIPICRKTMGQRRQWSITRTRAFDFTRLVKPWRRAWRRDHIKRKTGLQSRGL